MTSPSIPLSILTTLEAGYRIVPEECTDFMVATAMLKVGRYVNPDECRKVWREMISSSPKIEGQAGYRILPKECTDFMVATAMLKVGRYVNPDECRKIWREMISSSPKIEGSK